MSTHATISMLNQDGSVTSIYCHYDGYIGGVGHMLQRYFKTESYVEKFLARGHCSGVGDSIRSTVYRGCPPFEYEDWQDYEENAQREEYNYMYCDGKWTVRKFYDDQFKYY